MPLLRRFLGFCESEQRNKRMPFALLSKSRTQKQGSVKPAPKLKSAREQHSAELRFGLETAVFQASTASPSLAHAFQAKRNVGEPNNMFEQEAERVADVIVQRSASHGTDDANGDQNTHPTPRLASQTSISQLPSPEREALRVTHEVLQSPGQPLDSATRAFVEPRFGKDFSRVRVHTGAKAGEAARMVDAQAYTVGADIVFSGGSYAPESHQGSRLLAHELAHVVQQGCAGVLSPPPRGRWLEATAAAAGSARALASGGPLVKIAAFSAPSLARQPLSGRPAPVDKPRSLTQSLLKDEKNLDDAALEQEIKLIQQWLDANPSSPENARLRSELRSLEDEELERIEKREAEGRGPKEGTASKLMSIVHKGRLEVQRGLSPGYEHCFLARGMMEWRFEPPEPAEHEAKKQRMQIKFTPKRAFGKQTITFLQSLLETKEGSAGSNMATVDIEKRGAFRPFYGMDWNQQTKQWTPEQITLPQGYKNQPSSATDPAAYMFDEPWVYPGQGRVFESVAVVPETGETLGGLTWGVGAVPERDKRVECSDKTSAHFQLAIEKFYAPRTATSSLGEENYDVILDGYVANDAVLTADQEKQLDLIVAKIKGRPPLKVVAGGFGDAMDRDPMDASERRVQAVANYLTGKGVSKSILDLRTFGAIWARYELSTKESREGHNRRVQVRLFY
jgi:hypothetical protein